MPRRRNRTLLSGMGVGKLSGDHHDGQGKPPALAEKPLLLTVPETARLLRISRNTCYELVAQQRLPHVRLGRRILIPRHGLEQWIAQEARLPEPPPPVVSLLQRH